jgi:predicted RecB family nuclease
VVVREQAEANRQAHCARLAAGGEVVTFGGPAEMAAGREIVADADLMADGLGARCDFLMKVSGPSGFGRFSYEPVKVIGACRASRSDALGLAYQGIVLGEVQGRQPSSGTLVLGGDRPSKVKVAGKYKEVWRTIEALRAWTSQPVGDAPPLFLNKHCPSCPFRGACLQQAEKEDNLTLLDRMTPKLMRKYRDKGIFAVGQLSHIYKPRRSRKKAKRQVRHSLELQALAIRTGKVHIEHLPELPRSPVELFLDVEGVPDRDSHYLAGLLVCRGGAAEYEFFWADDAIGEATMWSALVERFATFPDSPVYHYGSYEKKAFATLAKRHGRGGGLSDRLVNVASSVYGKVYFPVRSNGLKPLGRFLGAAWTDPQASGLQSLALAAFLGMLGVFVLDLVLLCYPGMFFRHTFSRGAITLYSDEPIPASAERVLEDADKRLKRSPLFRERAAKKIRIYICNREWRFVLFANIRYKVGGLAYPPLTNNIFLRRAHIDANRLIGPSGNEVPGERTLRYFLAHEAVHTLIFEELGLSGYWRLPVWKDDGYADYIAKRNDFDYDHAVVQLRRGDRELDPLRSGLYLRYHLLVAYLLDRKGISVEEMLRQEFDPARLEEDILKRVEGP